jgi:polyribonucleotide nucleotidyltransferase
VIDVKHMGVDPRTKKAKVSRKETMPKPEVDWTPTTWARMTDAVAGRDDRRSGLDATTVALWIVHVVIVDDKKSEE